MKLLYIACPLTHKHWWIRLYRFVKVTRLAAKLTRDGYAIYSPITQSVPINLLGCTPHTWDFWRKNDEYIISKCDEVYVFTLPGWTESIGVNAEVNLALRLGIEVKYIDKDYRITKINREQKVY